MADSWESCHSEAYQHGFLVRKSGAVKLCSQLTAQQATTTPTKIPFWALAYCHNCADLSSACACVASATVAAASTLSTTVASTPPSVVSTTGSSSIFSTTTQPTSEFLSSALSGSSSTTTPSFEAMPSSNSDSLLSNSSVTSSELSDGLSSEETQSAPQRAEEYTNALDTGSETPGPSSIVSTTPEAMFSVAQDYAGAGFSFEESIPQNTDSVAPTTFVTNAASANNEAPSQSTSNADSPQLPPSTTVEGTAADMPSEESTGSAQTTAADGTPVADYAKVPDGIAAAENGQSAGTSIAEQSAAAPSEARHLSLRAQQFFLLKTQFHRYSRSSLASIKRLQLLVLPRSQVLLFLSPNPRLSLNLKPQSTIIPKCPDANGELLEVDGKTFIIHCSSDNDVDSYANLTLTA